MIEFLEDSVTVEEIKEKQTEVGLQIWAKTSAKVWEDFNVHKAFNKILATAYRFKYQMDGDVDSEADDD